jgi:aldehyde dehydrogenase (NAD+)
VFGRSESVVKALNYIDGSWRDSDRWEDVINPATEEACGVAAIASENDVDKAIGAARRAFDEGPWRRMSRFERAETLGRFRDELYARQDQIIDAAVRETGSPVASAGEFHCRVPLEHLDYFVEAARRDPRTSLPTRLNKRPDGTTWLGASVLVREPVGVVASISAYNQPFYLNVHKVGPALAMGNTVVLKPSPMTPFAAMIVAEAIDAAGFPPGVFNLAIGDAQVGVPLSSDPRIDMVSFTGSETVGAAVATQAAPTVKRVQLELGGKSAMILRADGDVGAAVAMGIGSATAMAGQGCSLVTRHLVHEDVIEEFTQRLVGGYEGLRVGDPADPATQVGPVITSTQRERVLGFIDRAVDEGAKLATGGGRPTSLERGYFVEPTVFTNVDNSSELGQREVFGPVVAVIPFRSDEEAVSIANDSWYGLGGAIYSGDVGKAFDMAEQVRTGQVLINGGAGDSPATDPFGGYKRSGLGRERGDVGLDDYTEVKVIKVHGG